MGLSLCHGIIEDHGGTIRATAASPEAAAPTVARSILAKVTLERRFPRLARRIVFFTGDSLNSEVRAFLERTKTSRVSKPFDFAELRRVVAQIGRESSVSTSQ